MNTQVKTLSAPSIRATLETAGEWLLRVLVAIGERSGQMRSARKAERLFALSDDDLAKLGLRRDEIMEHAFGRYMVN